MLILLLLVNYGQLKKIDNFHELTIKTKRIVGLKPVQTIMVCMLNGALSLVVKVRKTLKPGPYYAIKTFAKAITDVTQCR